MVFRSNEYEALLDEWKLENRRTGVEGFHRDGIINLEEWNKAPRKVMFILKETNSEQKDIDVRQRISKAAEMKTGWRRGQVLRRVGRWSYGLMKYQNGAIPEYPTDDRTIYQSPLSIAYVNLLKRNGGNTTGRKRLDIAVERCQNLIRRQIDLIDPEIVVLCGTYGPIKRHVIDLDKKSHRVHCDGRRIFINAHHPASRRLGSRQLYAQVLEAYDQFKRMPVSRHR